MKSNSMLCWTRFTRRTLQLGICLAVSLSTSTADAGVIPWLVDSLFGNSCRPYQSPCGTGYQTGYQPGYGTGYGTGYGRYSAGYSAYGCPPSGYSYSVPQRVYSQPMPVSSGYGMSYGSPYRVPCVPRLINPFAVLGGLSGILGCGPCGASYGRGYSAGWGCSPCGAGGCPISLPFGSTVSGAVGGWRKSSPAIRTFVDGPQASGATGIDTRALRPASDPDEDPGTVIPRKFEPPKAKQPIEDKEPVREPATKPPSEKAPTALDLSTIGTVVQHVVPSRDRLSRRVASSRPMRLRSIVVARSVFSVQPSLRSEVPGSMIAGRSR